MQNQKHIAKLSKHNPSVPIDGWSPKTGWENIVALDEIFVLPTVFNENFSLPTDVLKHKRSKYAPKLINKDIQGDSKLLQGDVAIDYIEAIENRYPQLISLLSSKPSITRKKLKKEENELRKEARKLSDQELKNKLSNTDKKAVISTRTILSWFAIFVYFFSSG